VLDMDSSESPTYGEQEGSAYNGHFGCTCKSGRRPEERYASVRAESTVRRYRAVNRRLRLPVADAGRDLPLPKPFKGAILASKPRASGECRLKLCLAR